LIVNRERIFSDFVESRGGDSLTMRFREEVVEKRPFSGPGDGRSVGDHEKWKGIIRKSFRGLVGGRGGEEQVL
jgi:hypothetical protein